jgi:hypothetical protein
MKEVPFVDVEELRHLYVTQVLPWQPRVAPVGAVRQAVAEHLGNWLQEHPQQAAAVLGRIIRGARHDSAPSAGDRADDRHLSAPEWTRRPAAP